MPFPKVLPCSETQTTTTRIWIQVSDSIFYINNRYAKRASLETTGFLDDSPIFYYQQENFKPSCFYNDIPLAKTMELARLKHVLVVVFIQQ